MKFQVQELRPEVLAFALLMEERLRGHDSDKAASWKSMSGRYLVVHTCSKSLALETAVRNEFEDPTRHAVDLANYCMMIADVNGALSEVNDLVDETTEIQQRIDKTRADIERGLRPEGEKFNLHKK
jgi:hypothetical protein